jgi:RNA polymerase sigma-70 factor (ECF subfamily)
MPEGREVDDVVLLEAWCQGDRAAGAKLFARHYPCIARFFHNKVNEAAQDDLVHQTFLACLAAVARFRGQACFRTYLFGIARNVLADHLRRLARHKARLDVEAEVDELPAVSFGLSPVTTAVQHEEQRLLLEALRRIPLLHQIALELHYWEELTAAEVGEVLGVPRDTAKTRLRNGRAYLKKQLRQIARSSDVLRSTLDNLERWARRTRAHLAPAPGADEVVHRAPT